ncbi:unnamed protein product [Lampetra fluviatilis]
MDDGEEGVEGADVAPRPPSGGGGGGRRPPQYGVRGGTTSHASKGERCPTPSEGKMRIHRARDSVMEVVCLQPHSSRRISLVVSLVKEGAAMPLVDISQQTENSAAQLVAGVERAARQN